MELPPAERRLQLEAEVCVELPAAGCAARPGGAVARAVAEADVATEAVEASAGEAGDVVGMTMR